MAVFIEKPSLTSSKCYETIKKASIFRVFCAIISPEVIHNAFNRKIDEPITYLYILYLVCETINFNLFFSDFFAVAEKLTAILQHKAEHCIKTQ
jgi:hypothetical protein